MTGECTERERERPTRWEGEARRERATRRDRATKRERANRQVSVSRRERAAKLKRTGEDGYLGRIKTVTRTQRATRR